MFEFHQSYLLNIQYNCSLPWFHQPYFYKQTANLLLWTSPVHYPKYTEKVGVPLIFTNRICYKNRRGPFLEFYQAHLLKIQTKWSLLEFLQAPLLNIQTNDFMNFPNFIYLRSTHLTLVFIPISLEFIWTIWTILCEWWIKFIFLISGRFQHSI